LQNSSNLKNDGATSGRGGSLVNKGFYECNWGCIFREIGIAPQIVEGRDSRDGLIFVLQIEIEGKPQGFYWLLCKDLWVKSSNFG
jgi:hypothetical protein